MEIKKVGGRFPITAVEVWELSQAEHYLLWGSGPDVVIKPWQGAATETHVTISNCDSVHNIRLFTSSSMVAAFGGKSLAVLSKVKGSFTLHSRLEQLDDLVLDFALRGTHSPTSESLDCYVGYAHNFVDIANISITGEYMRFARVHCSELSVLFHMAFASDATSEGLTIASGTVFGKIILWTVDATSCASSTLCKADDHEGVIFRIKWSQDGQKLISVADDRTLRLWQIVHDGPNPSALELLFTAWGHVSRVWDAVFLTASPDSDIATCSEDGTVKLWNHCGVCVSTMRGHSHHVWRLATCDEGALLVSAGNDSSVKVWDVEYQRRTCPDDPGSTVSTVPIPAWPVSIGSVPGLEGPEHSSSDVTNTQEVLSEEPLLTPAKKKGGAPSRRANGVCGVRVSPCLRWVVVVLVEGGVWLVHLPAQGAAAVPDWKAVTHLRSVVSTIDVLFRPTVDAGDVLSLRLAVALLNGTDTLLDIAVSSEGEASVRNRHDWRGHDMRTVNIWLPDLAEQYVITATVKGACAVWRVVDGEEPVPLWTCCLPSKEIATANLVAHCATSRSEYLVLGDARGSVFVYGLPSASAAAGAGPQDLAPVAAFSKIHGTDPVSCIAHCGTDFVTAGHDGVLHVFTEIVAECGVSCGRTAVPSDLALSWAHTAKINCLPITTPDQVLVTESGLYACGYHGSLYMMVDVRRGYQLLRVEGGGWKRPHRCALNSTVAGALAQGLPACTFVCPAPLEKNNTGLQLFGAVPSTSSGVTVPLHLGCPSMGRVGYCAVFITAKNSALEEEDGVPDFSATSSDYVVVGGEDSCVKVYSVPKLELVQEVSLSMNSSLKSLCSVTSAASSSRGIVVGGGGKLQYYIWMFDRSLGCTSRSTLGDVLHTGAKGSIWAKATQDHRILSVHAVYVGSSTVTTAGSAAVGYVEKYAILLCDSRGIAVVGMFEHSLLGAGGAQVASFSMLHQILASQCPLLSCALSRLPDPTSGALIAVAGDTTGTISVWRISGDNITQHSTRYVSQQSFSCVMIESLTNSNARSEESGQVERLTQYAAHTMGANALCSAWLPDGSLAIYSVGDDQALSCGIVDLQVTVERCYSVVLSRHYAVCLYVTMTQASGAAALRGLTITGGASGSALKGVRLIGINNGVASLVTVGYDQRLYVWRVRCDTDSAAPTMEWVCGAPVNVSDVGSVDVGVISGGTSSLCCVVGEGIQLFSVCGDSIVKC
jgi:WD40 repeat protein